MSSVTSTMMSPTNPTTSNVLLLEHLNLNLSPTALALARRLFCEGLGCTDDPRPARMNGRTRDNLLWANAGLQQLHLPVDSLGTGGCPKRAQQLDGSIVFLIPAGSSSAIAGRISAAAPEALLEMHREQKQAQAGFGTPWLHVRALDNVFELVEAAPTPASAPSRRQFTGGDAAVCRGQPGFTLDDGEPPNAAIPRPIGILALKIRAPLDALACIGAFWEEVMGARVQRHLAVPCSSTTHTAAAAHPVLHSLRVCFDGVAARPGECLPSSQWIDFIGVDEGHHPPLLPYDGHHVALYLRDWEAAYLRAAEARVLFHGTRFSDRCSTLEEARTFHQFRTLGMRPASCGGKVGRCCAGGAACQGWQLELEVRALSHPSCPL